MNPDLPRRRVALCALLTLAVTGCGPKAEFAEVTGVVLLDGKPMPEALVEFVPDPQAGTHGPVASATTDEEGRFHLVSQGQQPGAVIGTHRVVIQDERSLPRAVTDFAKVKPPPYRPPRLPNVYSNATSTPLRQEVKPGSQTVTLEVKSKSDK
jgi:hypothetical protein